MKQTQTTKGQFLRSHVAVTVSHRRLQSQLRTMLVTQVSDDFENDFSEKWKRTGNLPDNATWFVRAAKRGTHSVQMQGSPATAKGDLDCFMQRVVSTVGQTNIQVSFHLGAEGLRSPAERVAAVWADQGLWSPGGHWHQLKEIKGGGADNDGALHHYSFSLPKEANYNPNLVLWFGVWGLSASNQVAYLDDIVVTGQPSAANSRATKHSAGGAQIITADGRQPGDVSLNREWDFT